MIPGCILAGGQGRRLGGKGKAFINLLGKPLINHSIDNYIYITILIYTFYTT